jgi:hypothetical protein
VQEGCTGTGREAASVGGDAFRIRKQAVCGQCRSPLARAASRPCRNEVVPGCRKLQPLRNGTRGASCVQGGGPTRVWQLREERVNPAADGLEQLNARLAHDDDGGGIGEVRRKAVVLSE